MQKNIILLVGLAIISFVSSSNLTDEKCIVVYDFIKDHYNGTLNYLVYEFEDLQSATNLSTTDLKDYLINFEEKCPLILPFQNYSAVKEINSIDKSTKEQTSDFIKSMFDDPKSFLMFISILIVIILLIKIFQNQR